MKIPKLFNITISIDWIFLIFGIILYFYNHVWFSGLFIGGAFFYGLKEQVLRLNEVYKTKR